MFVLLRGRSRIRPAGHRQPGRHMAMVRWLGPRGGDFGWSRARGSLMLFGLGGRCRLASGRPDGSGWLPAPRRDSRPVVADRGNGGGWLAGFRRRLLHWGGRRGLVGRGRRLLARGSPVIGPAVATAQGGPHQDRSEGEADQTESMAPYHAGSFYPNPSLWANPPKGVRMIFAAHTTETIRGAAAPMGTSVTHQKKWAQKSS